MSSDNQDVTLEMYRVAASSDDIKTGLRHVIVERMDLVVAGRDDIQIDLTGDLSMLRDSPITVKEGVEFQIRIVFRVQHEIISGLRYHHVVSRKGISVDKQSYMVGSYSAALHSYLTPIDTVPKGMMARGLYTIKSRFMDDDKNVYLAWEWSMSIQKEWA